MWSRMFHYYNALMAGPHVMTSGKRSSSQLSTWNSPRKRWMKLPKLGRANLRGTLCTVRGTGRSLRGILVTAQSRDVVGPMSSIRLKKMVYLA